MENQEEIRKEFRESWAKLGLTDDIKDDIEDNVSNLTNEETLQLAMRIAQKTIGFDLLSTNFEDIGKTIQELIERFTKGKYTTNGANGLTEQLVAYPTGKEGSDD